MPFPHHIPRERVRWIGIRCATPIPSTALVPGSMVSHTLIRALYITGRTMCCSTRTQTRPFPHLLPSLRFLSEYQEVPAPPPPPWIHCPSTPIARWPSKSLLPSTLHVSTLTTHNPQTTCEQAATGLGHRSHRLPAERGPMRALPTVDQVLSPVWIQKPRHRPYKRVCWTTYRHDPDPPTSTLTRPSRRRQ